MLVYMLACHILSPPLPPPEGLVGWVRGLGGGASPPLDSIPKSRGTRSSVRSGKKGKKKGGGGDARVRYNGMFLIKVNQPVDNKRTFH